MVEFITYKGKKYPIRISYYVLMMAQKETGINLDELESNFETHQSLLWYALIAGHKMSNAGECTIDKNDIVWVLDECYFEFQTALYKFARAMVEVQEKALNEPKKK